METLFDNNMKFNFPLILVFFFIHTISWGQIITDRPDQTESSVTLPINILQVESGYSFQEEEVFNTLFRYGISNSIELRLNTNLLFLDNYNGIAPHGRSLESESPKFGDLELGAKIQIFNFEEKHTTIAFLTHLSIPTASKYYSNNEYGTLNRLLVSHDLSKTFSIGYNIGYNKIYREKGVFIYTLAIAKSINKWGFYVEIFGEQGNNRFQSNFDTGITYLIKNNLQFDLSFGEGLNNDLSYFSTGLSWNNNLVK